MTLTEKLRTSTSGLLRWVGVFGVGFIVGYGLMSFAVEPPSAEELPNPVAQSNAEATPIELPSIDVEEVASVREPVPRVAEAANEATKEVALEAAPPVVSEIPRPWWETCQDRRCRLDFGGISGNLTIRKASLVHGSTISWDKDMASKPRLESLPTERPLEVHVVAIAMSEQGKPVAAEIVWRRRGRTIKGVITLDLGEAGKRVVMHP